jgi:hypothetical protein
MFRSMVDEATDTAWKFLRAVLTFQPAGGYRDPVAASLLRDSDFREALTGMSNPEAGEAEYNERKTVAWVPINDKETGKPIRWVTLAYRAELRAWLVAAVGLTKKSAVAIHAD